MLILDTDHLSQLERPSPARDSLNARLSAASDDVGTTIVCLEEQIRGRLSQFRRIDDPVGLIEMYGRLQRTLLSARELPVLSWDRRAAAVWERLRRMRLGVRTMDLRIAYIAIANQSTLLSRNLRDFRRVPDLQVEDWPS